MNDKGEVVLRFAEVGSPAFRDISFPYSDAAEREIYLRAVVAMRDGLRVRGFPADAFESAQDFRMIP